MLCNISIVSRATEVSGPTQTFNFSIDWSRENVWYTSCNYGDVEEEFSQYVNSDNINSSTYHYLFHVFETRNKLFTSSSDAYAYKVTIDVSNVSRSSSRVMFQNYCLSSVDEFLDGNPNSIIRAHANTGLFTTWIVTDNLSKDYYFGLITYYNTSYMASYGSSGSIIPTFNYGSYSIQADVALTLTPYSKTGYLQEIANNSKETNEKLDETNEKLGETNEKLDEANETSKGIFASITEFFGSFFKNLIDSVISLFVPSADEMGELFNQLNQFFSDRFGFLYAPFDYMIRLMQVFLSSTGGTSLTFPGFSIMGYEVWPDLTYDLSEDPLVGQICGYVRIGTGILLAGYFIMYLQNFFKERFGSG